MMHADKAKHLTKQDAFPYECKNCGNCCRFYTNIRLTPLDIFKMARYLSMDTKNFINTYCTVNDKKEILPVVEFKKSSESDYCPLYENNKCTVHVSKPAACALYPLARFPESATGQPLYFVQPHDCSDNAGNRSVSDWLKMYNLTDEEGFVTEWHSFLTEAMEAIAKTGAVAAIRIGTNEIYLHSLILTYMYFQYNGDKDFLTQFKDNRETINEMLELFLEFGND